MPKLNTTTIRTSIFEWYVVGCGSKNFHPKTYVFKRDWTMCSEHANHFKFNDQHDRGSLNDHLMSVRIFTLIMS